MGRRDLRIGTVRLPDVPPDGVVTLLDFFRIRFPRQGEAVWRRRFEQGMVYSAQGPLAAESPYAPGLETRYVRETDGEWPVRTDFRILYQDRDLLVVDKPPFLPVTPAGHYLENCLLGLLLRETGLPDLTPLHRLDKDTSGLVLFSANRATRGHFHSLFHPPRRHIQEVYLALCEERDRKIPSEITLEDHIDRDPEAYHLQRVFPDRPANSVCVVERLERCPGRALAQIGLMTGRKHQIRVQLRHAGWPVVQDRLYGSEPRHDPQDIEAPLMLTCSEIRIRDFALPLGAGQLEGRWQSRFRPLLTGEMDAGDR